MDKSENLPNGTRVGRVRLRTRDIERALAFYEGVLGLRRVPGGVAGEVAVGIADYEGPLAILRDDPTAAPARPNAPGLFHFAILVPSRADLGRVILHLNQAGWPLQGASDHIVSEALYLADPDGNGIEIYRDRPRSEWQFADDELVMGIEPMDLRGVVRAAEAEERAWEGLPQGTRMGHMHLQVSSIEQAAAFYHGVIGFDVTVRSYPGALFYAAGGYHHHLGTNIWRSAGTPAADAGPRVGLIDWTLHVPDDSSRAALLRRAGIGDEEIAETVLADPDGIRVRIAA